MVLRIFEVLSVLIFAHVSASKDVYVNTIPDTESLLENTEIKTIIPRNMNVLKDDSLLKLIRTLPIVNYHAKDENEFRTNLFEDIVRSLDANINIDNLQHNENSVVINNPRRLPKSKEDIRVSFKPEDERKYDKYHESYSNSDSNEYHDSPDYNSETFEDLTRIAKDISHKNKETPVEDRNKNPVNSLRSNNNNLRSKLYDKLKRIANKLKKKFQLRRSSDRGLKYILRRFDTDEDEETNDIWREWPEKSKENNDDDDNNSKGEKKSLENDSNDSFGRPKRFKLIKSKDKKEKKSKKPNKEPKETKKTKKSKKSKWQPVFESADASVETEKPYSNSFEVADTNEFHESGELSTEKPKKKRKTKNIYHTKKEVYIQGPKRLVHVGPNDLRKRLQHFLPKRYHWREEDFARLGYFWFNGPQGREPPGPWKVPY